MQVKHNSPDLIGPEGNLQLSQDLGGFLQASLKLTTHPHLLLEKLKDNNGHCLILQILILML